jgi:tyrosine-protein phosphatase YwqE
MTESLFLLKKMREMGYEHIITTPHIMVDAYRNTPRNVREGLIALRSEAMVAGIDITIDAAAEYYLDEGFYKHLRSGNLLSIKNKYLLFETSYVSKPLQLEEMIFEIGAAGYTPLMAHPERYRYVSDPKKEYGRFKELGVLLQLDINSLGGYYGRSARERAHWLVERGWVDYLGSDLHGRRHLDFLERTIRSGVLEQVMRKCTIRNDNL